MKVILVNGSPHNDGCVYTALSEVAKTLNTEGIDTEFFHIGNKPISGCIACNKCADLKNCSLNDNVNEFIQRADSADAFVFGSPVYYAAMNGSLSSFMDRAFYAGAKSGVFRYKPAAAVVNARRGGNTAAFDEMNKYFTISEMPVISSCYWNMTHGLTPEDVAKDLEGLYTLRVLGQNMAWFLKCKEIGMNNGIEYPVHEPMVRTHFIR